MPLVAKGLTTRWPLKSGKTFCWSDIRNSEVYEAHVIKQLEDNTQEHWKNQSIQFNKDMLH